MEQSNKIERSETWDNIYEVLARLDIKETTGDALDRPSAATEIEGLFLKLLGLQSVRLSLPDSKYMRSLLPEWTKKAPKGLCPTMYGTGTQKGDQKVIDNINRILGNEA